MSSCPFKTATACGPSGMRVQHLLDAMKATLPLGSLQTTLYRVVNMLLAGQAPACLAPLIARGNLTALLKTKESGWDVRPIAVGEVLRWLMSKCACYLLKHKAMIFSVWSCMSRGSEKIIHCLWQCIISHKSDLDFGVLKIDMQNAFNLVSRQAILGEFLSFCLG